jgi:Ricin-type beta-trefoil lectin domain-like
VISPAPSRRTRVNCAATLVLAAVLALLAAPSLAHAFRLENARTHRCLAVQGAANWNGSPAFQYNCRAYLDQQWDELPAGRLEGQPLFRLRNRSTGKCLAIRGAANWNGSPAFQYTCTWAFKDQLWYRVYPARTGPFQLRNFYTGRCLAIEAVLNRNGSPAFQYDCSRAIGDGWYMW